MVVENKKIIVFRQLRMLLRISQTLDIPGACGSPRGPLEGSGNLFLLWGPQILRPTVFYWNNGWHTRQRAGESEVVVLWMFSSAAHLPDLPWGLLSFSFLASVILSCSYKYATNAEAVLCSAWWTDLIQIHKHLSPVTQNGFFPQRIWVAWKKLCLHRL